MRAQAKLHVAPTTTHGYQRPESSQGFVQRWFLPRKESRLMADEAQRTSGLFIPFPMLGIMLTLVLTLGGGIIGMYVKLDTMNSTMIMRDADHQRERQQAWEKIEQMQVYIQNDRERLGKLEERVDSSRRNRN